MLLRKKIFLLLLILIIQPGYSQQSDYSWPLPEKWTREIIPFPVNFAPRLDYRGIEEVHFMPGWRGTDSLPNQWWSYTFIWFLDSVIIFDADKLKRDLTIYFEGLQREVRKKPVDSYRLNVTTEVRVKRHSKKDPGNFSGNAKILDVFSSDEPVKLNMKISFFTSSHLKKTIVFFELSPKRFHDLVWHELDRHISEFRITALSDP
jgi:hypothetical protein